jgi:hypothetical protein
MPDPMFPYVAVDLTVNDTLFQPDGTKLLKAAGRTIDTTDAEAGTDIAPHLVTDSTALIGHGGQVVAAGPTRTKLRASSTPCRRITVKANVANTATLYVGLSTVTADANNTTGGFPLSPGEALTFGIDDVSSVYIHGTAGEGAAFAYEE